MDTVENLRRRSLDVRRIVRAARPLRRRADLRGCWLCDCRGTL